MHNTVKTTEGIKIMSDLGLHCAVVLSAGDPVVTVSDHMVETATKARYTPVILALRRLRQEDHEFKTSLSYIVKPVSK